MTLLAVGADDCSSLRELVFARVLAVAQEACCTSPHGAVRAADFEACVRSIGSDPQLTDLYERLLPVRKRVRAMHPVAGPEGQPG
jgi:hypothetical protein